ncbi:MAG TPA: hypothetical protein VMT00_01925 [Thermoanaerobaculia bacterium]|nr:hypothetical protein [Thermoanaerobaculia bacterium]
MSAAGRSSIVVLLLVALLPFAGPLARGEVFSFRDHTDYFIPLRHFTAETLLSGSLPLWNPYNGSGEPWMANPQTGVFYPPAWLFLALPFEVAYAMFLFVHLAVAGIGSLLLFRRWFAAGASLIGSVGVMLGGPTLSLLDVNNNLASFSWLPLALWLAARLADHPAGPLRLASGGVLALMFLGGEPYLFMIGAGVWLVFYSMLAGRRGSAKDVGISALWAVALSAVQLLPFLELLSGSDRVSGLDPRSAMRNSLAPVEWSMAAISRSILTGDRLLMESQQFIASLYLGLPVVIGAALFLLSRPRRGTFAMSWMLFWSSVAVLMGAVAAGTHFPFLSALQSDGATQILRHPSRVAPIAALALIALAVAGLDRLDTLSRTVRAVTLFGGVGVAGLAMMRFGRPPLSSFGLAEQAIVALLLAVVVLFRPTFLARRRAGMLAGLVFAIDLFLNASPLLVTSQFRSQIEPWNTLIGRNVKFLRLGPMPVAALGDRRHEWMSGYLNLLNRQFDVSTPAPVASNDYLLFEKAATRRARYDLLDFLSVGYILTDKPLESPRLRERGSARSVRIYENRERAPMVTLWTRFEPAESRAGALEKLARRAIDPAATIAITRPPTHLATSLGGEGGPDLDARMYFVIENNEVGIHGTFSRPVIVVVNQTLRRGWRVRVDGEPREPLEVNGLFRGVAVSSGEHDIHWSYRPGALVAGAIVSATSLLVLVSFAGIALRRRFQIGSAAIRKTEPPGA